MRRPRNRSHDLKILDYEPEPESAEDEDEVSSR